MKIEQIRKIAREKGLWNCELFEKFITKRFPNEASEEYVREWVGRFLSGNPTAYMDSESKKAYKSLF